MYWTVTKSAIAVCILIVVTGCGIEAGKRRDLPPEIPIEKPIDENVDALLVLKIECDRKVVKAGERPKFTASIENHGNGRVQLVKPGDGSSAGRRTPRVGWSVIRIESVDGNHPSKRLRFSGTRCANINSLKADEVFTIEPGGRVQLRVGWPYTRPIEPGAYRIRFRYTNDPDQKWKGMLMGEHDPEAMRGVRNSTPCSLVSNELVIHIRSKEKPAPK